MNKATGFCILRLSNQNWILKISRNESGVVAGMIRREVYFLKSGKNVLNIFLTEARFRSFHCILKLELVSIKVFITEQKSEINLYVS